MKQKGLVDFPWSLTQLAANLDLEFRTAMNWRSGLFKINPSVKVPGKSKMQFSRADAAKFIIVRRLLRNGLDSSSIQQFLDFLDEYKILFPLFPPSVPPPGELREKLTQLAAEGIGRTFLICRPPNRSEAFIIVDHGVSPPETFNSLLKKVLPCGWPMALLSLEGVVIELLDREEALRNNREYKAPDIGGQICKALGEIARKNAELGLPLNTPPLE